MRGSCLSSAVLLAVVSGGMAAAQSSQPRNVRTWLDAVNAHVPGGRDESVTRIAPWSLNELDAASSELHQKRTGDEVGLIERALVLHADIAILHREAGGYNLPPGPGDVTLFNDGRAVGQMSRTVHWEFARRLLDRAPEGDDRARIGRRFYRATSAVLQLWGEYAELSAHLAGGRRLLGEDAVLLLYEGTMRQAFAGPRVQRFFDERRRAEARERPTATTRLPQSASGNSPTEVVTLPAASPSAAESRTQAERAFRRALAIDASLVEARIRLAHVLGDAGRHDAAAAELKQVPAAGLPAVLDYYASLLTGREARLGGQVQAAHAAFERAAALYPNASAPKFGLSELAMAQRNESDSLSYLIRSDTARRVDANEPWWWLDRVHDPSAGTLLDDLRRMAPR